MFRTTKPLIGTPNDSRNGHKNFEFTPIGYNKVNDENKDPRTNTIKRTSKLNLMSTLTKNKNPFEQSPLANSVRGGSSFIEPESFDTIHYSDNKKKSALQKTSSPIPNGFDNHDLLNNGSNPVRQQQENVSKLQDENYNLKVKIASLTRFLNSITNNEQQEIYQQNSELQEKLIEMRGQISLLNQELASSKGPNNQSEIGNQEAGKYRDEIKSLNKIIQELRESNENHHELEREINKLHQVIEELEAQNVNQKQSSISPAYVEKLEEQLDDLKEKLHDVEYELNRKDEELDEKDDKIDQMEELLERRKSMSVQQQDQVGEELENMKQLLKEKDTEIKSLMSKVDERDLMIGEIKADYNSLNEKLKQDYAKMKSQPDISKIQQKLQELQIQRDQKADQLKQFQTKYENLLRDRSDLSQQLKQSLEMVHGQENLIDELKSNKSSSEQIYKFSDELKAKVKSLEKELHGLSLERDVLQKQLAASDHEIIALKNNNERTYKAYNELKKNQQQKQHNQYTKETDNAGFWKSEIESLSNQINDLNVENKKLSKELQSEKVLKKLDAHSYDRHELKNLATKCNELQLEMSEKESSFSQTLNRYKREIEQYKSMIREKEDELRKVANELRVMKYSTTQQIDDEKLEALKVKSSKEYQIKAMKIELDSLKEEHETEVKSYKKLIERLKNASNGKDVDEVKTRLSTTANETGELLQKINDKNTKIRILNNKLTEALSGMKLLEKEVSKLEDDKIALLNDNKRLDAKIDLLSDELMSQRKETERLLSKASESSNYELRRELKLREKQLDDSNREFNEMKHDLINKYRDIHDEKALLERKIDKIIKNYRQLQANFNVKSENDLSSKELVMTQDQAHFFKMKYNKSTYVINDLKFINSFMLKSIQATNSHIKKDVKKLQNAGIYPDYELICTKKPSLSVLFKFVVAAVRIKRKTEHSSIRNKKLENLKFKLELQDY